MKKIISTAIAVFSVFNLIAFSSCGKTEKKEVKEHLTPETVKTQKVSKDDFLLGSWVSFSGTSILDGREQMKRLSESGLNFVSTACACPLTTTSTGDNLQWNLLSNDWWKEMDGLMTDLNMMYFFSSAMYCGANNNYNAVKRTADNNYPEAVENARRNSTELENCIGYMLMDEPAYGQLRSLGNYAKQYAAIKDGRYCFVNMNPGGSTAAFEGHTYEEYFEEWIEAGKDETGKLNVEWISHDYYPLHSGNTIHPGVYADMEAMKNVANKYGVKAHAYISSCGWGSNFPMPNFNQIKWQINAYLSYGFKGISYFNYVMWLDEGCYSGLIDLKGNVMDKKLYEDVTAFNWELRAMSDIIMNVKCVHAYHTKAYSGAEAVPSDWIISNARKLKGQYILSEYEGINGGDNYISVFSNNFSSTSSETFELAENNDIVGFEWYNQHTGKFEKIDVENGEFTLDFEPSELKYLKIINA